MAKYEIYELPDITIAVDGTTGTVALGSLNGRLAMVRATLPNFSASQTTTFDIRDENDAPVWHVAGKGEAQAWFIMPSEGSSSVSAPDWGTADPVPLASNLKNLGYWDLTLTLSAAQTVVTATITNLAIYYDTK